MLDNFYAIILITVFNYNVIIGVFMSNLARGLTITIHMQFLTAGLVS